MKLLTGEKKDVNIELTPEDPIRAKKRRPDVRTNGRRFSGGPFGGGNRTGSGPRGRGEGGGGYGGGNRGGYGGNRSSSSSSSSSNSGGGGGYNRDRDRDGGYRGRNEGRSDAPRRPRPSADE